jgi:hypothetical protein
MAYNRLRLAVSLSFSIGTLVLVVMLITSQLAVAALPLMDATGIGGIFLQASSFEGNDAKVYPVQGTGIDTEEPIDADTPVCEQRPMIAIELGDAFIEGFNARKDIQLPHLQDRWMSIEISQPDTGQIDATPDGNITLYTTQLQADELIIRNVLIREGQPGEFASQDATVAPRNQNLLDPNTFPDNPTDDKFGPYSGEFYIEAGDTVNPDDPGIVANDDAFDDDNFAVAAWIHGITARKVSFINPSGPGGISLDVSFPTDASVESYYNGKLGFSGDETGSKARDNYFDCVPVEVQ